MKEGAAKLCLPLRQNFRSGPDKANIKFSLNAIELEQLNKIIM